MEKRTRPQLFGRVRGVTLEQLPYFDRDEPLSVGVVASQLSGELQVDLLEEALRRVMERHDALRARMVADGTSLSQEVLTSENALCFTQKEVPSLDVARSEIVAVAEQGADLFGPPMRCTLYVAGSEVVASISVAHPWADAWAISLVNRDLWTEYRRAARGEPALDRAWGLRDRSEVQAKTGPHLSDAALAHWQSELGDGSAFVFRDRPTQDGCGAPPTSCGQSTPCRTGSLNRRLGATTSMVTLAGYGVALADQFGTDEVVVLASLMTRDVTGPGADEVGFCQSIVPIRLSIGPNPAVADVVPMVRRKLALAVAHSQPPYSFTSMLSDLEQRSLPAASLLLDWWRTAGRRSELLLPSFNSIRRPQGLLPTADLDDGSLQIAPFDLQRTSVPFPIRDLMCSAEVGSDCDEIRIVYLEGAIGHDSVARLLGRTSGFFGKEPQELVRFVDEGGTAVQRAVGGERWSKRRIQ